MTYQRRCRAWAAALLSLALVGCAVQAPYRQYDPATSLVAAVPMESADAQLIRLGGGLREGRTEIHSAPPGTCGPTATPVVRLILPEAVLFATDSDQAGPGAAPALEDIATRVVQQAPDAELTVLGHTDAIGSDAYNLDLSKRRAVTVLRALAERGLDPKRLSAVAIGKRQPAADDSTAEGRALNRRVEILVSRCLRANLAVVAAQAPDRTVPEVGSRPNRPAEVLRLDPSAGDGLASVASVTVQPLHGATGIVRASAPPRVSRVLPPADVARPSLAPHYQPRVLAPGAEPRPLGPAVAY